MDWLRDDLVDKGILRRVDHRVLFVTYHQSFPAEPVAAETQLRERLRTHMTRISHLDPPQRDDALIGLLNASKLLGQVWSEAEQEQLQPQILERTKRTPIGQSALQAAQAARSDFLRRTSTP